MLAPVGLKAFMTTKPAVALSRADIAARAMALLQSRAAKAAEIAPKASSPPEVEQLKKGAQEVRMELRSKARNEVRDTIQRLAKELAVIKKVWADNPKEMARQLARVVKQLAAALKEYKAAAKAAGEAEITPPGGAAVTAGATPEASAANAYDRQAKAAASGQESEAVREARADAELAKEMKGFLAKIKEELMTARTKAIPRREEKAEAFEDADKALEELERELEKFEGEAKKALPVPGATG